MEVYVSNDEEDDDDEYNVHCNRRISGAFGSFCKNGVNKRVLGAGGWVFKETTGRNSLIYMKDDNVLKIVKAETLYHNRFCGDFPIWLQNFQTLHRRLGKLAPTVTFVDPCKYSSDSSRIAIVMKNAGTPDSPPLLPERLHDMILELVETDTFSTDIVTYDGHVNYGNLLFRDGKVTIIDTDAVTNFVSTEAIDFTPKYEMWAYVLLHCIYDRTITIPFLLQQLFSSHSTPLFS